MPGHIYEYPIELALKAYQDNADPQRAAERDRDGYLIDLAATRQEMERYAKTDAQRETLDAELTAYSQAYLGRWRRVLEIKAEGVEIPMEPRGITRLQYEHLGFFDWQRKAKANMRQTIVAAGQPNSSRWVDRLQPAVEGRSL